MNVVKMEPFVDVVLVVAKCFLHLCLMKTGSPSVTDNDAQTKEQIVRTVGLQTLFSFFFFFFFLGI